MPCTLLCPASRSHGAIFGQVLGPARPVWSKALTCHDLDILTVPYMLLESHGNMWELQFFLFELLVRNGLNEGECQLGSFAIVAPSTLAKQRDSFQTNCITNYKRFWELRAMPNLRVKCLCTCIQCTSFGAACQTTRIFANVARSSTWTDNDRQLSSKNDIRMQRV